MDWKYLLTLSPEELNEEEKDELYNTIAWFNSSSEELTVRKYSALFRISQEILKYKGEQVETLVHELDELAIKQGEEEAKKADSDTEGRSSKSRKSSSTELENLEQKYLELRTKYKKQIKSNEKYLTEIEKLKKSINILNQEKQNLQSELQLAHTRDDSQSDISENVQEQNKELVNSIHNKNKQISDLLHDIEEVDKENFQLREKLTSVRDELAVATKEMTLLSENCKASKVELNEYNETIQRLRSENEMLTNDIEVVLEQKQELQSQLEEFTKEVNSRIDIWKKLLSAKEEEIKKLKQMVEDKPEGSVSTPSRQSYENEESDLTALNRVLSQREHQLLEVKTQLQAATKDMEESTQLIKKLHSENELSLKKTDELTSTITSLTEQLKTAHKRCQELQEQLTFSDRDREDKQKDLNEIVAKLNQKGQTDLAQYINEIQEIKAQKRVLEKQVMNLVKTTNKLQDSLEQFSRENELLRDKLGIQEEEIICTDAITIKHKLQTKDAEKMRKQVMNMEEEKINMRNEIHKLNKSIALLNKQIVNMTENPNMQLDVDQRTSANKVYKQDLKVLSEENEALRKGMHEILDAVHSKKGASGKEIKSETLEKLLRALDVKHISGWYHPAMRLQAELHNEQGISAELREQLRQVRSELCRLKKSITAETYKTLTGDVNEQSLLPTQKQSPNKILGNSKPDQPELFLSDQLETGQAELLENFRKEELSMKKEIEQLNSKIKDLSEDNEMTMAKLKAILENEPELSPIQKLAKEIENSIILTRKNSYLEDSNTRLRNDILNLKSDNMAVKSELTEMTGEYSLRIQQLQKQINDYDSKIEVMVDSERYKELQDKLDTITVKYRELLHNVKNTDENQQFEINLLKKSEELCRNEKEDLKVKITELIKKLHSHKEADETVDCKVQSLSKKLAEAEVNEITERQRADHTNSLYELVREQLHKSEERFKEFETYNKEILRKNLILQEQLKDVENKLLSFVEDSVYKNLEVKFADLSAENGEISKELAQTKQKFEGLQERINSTNLWTNLQEQELLSLKHQIVDLQATTDEKTVIARISGDIIQARANEELWRAKFESLNKEYIDCQQQLQSYQATLEKNNSEHAEKQDQLKKKIRILEELLVKKKFQYFGCIPLISEEQFVKNLRQLFAAKHDALKTLDEVECIKKDTLVLKEQSEIELANIKATKDLVTKKDTEVKKLLKWQQEKKSILMNEVKFRRQLEFKDMQLNHALQRIQMQDSHLMKLEEELLLSHHNFDLDVSEMSDGEIIESPKASPRERTFQSEDPKIPEMQKHMKTQETQTVRVDNVDATKSENKEDSDMNLKIELLNANNDLSMKNQLVDQLKSKVSELEKNVSLFRKQLGDKQSQISFYEKHIMELQNKREDTTTTTTTTTTPEITPQIVTEETIALKNNVKYLQESLTQKDQSLLSMQSLLKQDRDKHSLAAARMQDEMKVLTKLLNEEKKKSSELQKFNEETHPSKAAIEQYIHQVHALETHAAELHTKATSLESQLQASREEAVRWRTLASDRLNALDELRITLSEQHKAEIAVYKNESEKWRRDVNGLKDLISKHTSEFENAGSDLSKIMKEKDNKINELTVALRQASNNSKKIAEKAELSESNKILELESANEQLIKEHETIRKRFEQLISRERSAREEIRELRAQLVKKPISARSDKSEKNIKDQLQKKIASLEKEVEELQVKLQAQVNINEQHRLRAAEDFEKWKKQKQWQQSIEKLKNKLKERETETLKLQQTATGYRILIERLEREKHNLENRLKNMKNAAVTNSSDRIENFKVENMRLVDEIEKLRSRLEIQQHHSGSLGAAMLQEKLEGQERKIAILELSAKGTVEIRAELERLQTSVSNLQKKNICLEAENLEMKLDLEKSSKEVPYLREQVNHLENYVEALKKEAETQAEEKSKELSQGRSPSPRQVSELEKTVFILKRVVEKLQAENKRLLSGRRSLSDRPSSSEKLRRDLHRLKEQYAEAVRKVAHLEKELGLAHKKMQILESVGDREGFSTIFNELSQAREQLEQKSQMLEKVKLLLQRAAAKEKTLLEEIAILKAENFAKQQDSVSSEN